MGQHGLDRDRQRGFLLLSVAFVLLAASLIAGILVRTAYSAHRVRGLEATGEDARDAAKSGVAVAADRLLAQALAIRALDLPECLEGALPPDAAWYPVPTGASYAVCLVPEGVQAGADFTESTYRVESFGKGRSGGRGRFRARVQLRIPVAQSGALAPAIRISDAHDPEVN